MAILLLFLTITAPVDTQVSPICGELAVILEEAVEGGYINEQEAVDVLSRCAVGGGF